MDSTEVVRKKLFQALDESDSYSLEDFKSEYGEVPMNTESPKFEINFVKVQTYIL